MTTYMYFLVHICSFNKDIFFGLIKCKHFTGRQQKPTVLCLFGQSVDFIYTGQASMDMDISMDIHAKSVDMDIDRKLHIHGNPHNTLDTRSRNLYKKRVLAQTNCTTGMLCCASFIVNRMQLYYTHKLVQELASEFDYIYSSSYCFLRCFEYRT